MPVKQKSSLRQREQWRRKSRLKDDSDGGIRLSTTSYGTHFTTPESNGSLAAELGGATSSDEFEKQVAQKSSTFLIGRQEAETEVFTDLAVKKTGSVDKALLFVVSKVKMEAKIQLLVNNLIQRGANTSTSDADNKSSLHYAVERNLKGVAVKLLENDALPQCRDKEGTLPLKVAMDKKNDEMCAILLAYMPNGVVRNLFLCDGNKDAEFSFHQLLRTGLQRTILSVLDCMIESQGDFDRVRVYYNVLDCDRTGRCPGQKGFDSMHKSPLQVIAKEGNKNIVNHDTVRLLIRRKWKKYARRKFEWNTFLFILALFCITYSAIVAVGAPDPTKYDTPLQISRAVFEVISLIIVSLHLFTELNQIRRHKLEYFQDKFNWFDISYSILLLTVIPLRFTGQNSQWHVYAFGYLFCTIRIFKFASVFRQTGAYTQILSRILAYDFIQFGVLFAVVLLAFSGSFFLSLRGDGDLDTHSETSTFWGILYVGVRSLTEAQPVLEYTGEDGYKTVSVIFMLCFLFTCIVILLNILIAQLSDTYQKVQQDAQRGLEVNRAWIVARVELNTFFCARNYRVTHYIEHEDIADLRDVLTKWDSPPLNEMNKYIRDIWDSLDNHKFNLLTIQHRMARQENSLRKIQDHLQMLVDSGGIKTLRSRPRFYHSNSKPKYSEPEGHVNRGKNSDEKEGDSDEDEDIVNGGLVGETTVNEDEIELDDLSDRNL